MDVGESGREKGERKVYRRRQVPSVAEAPGACSEAARPRCEPAAERKHRQHDGARGLATRTYTNEAECYPKIRIDTTIFIATDSQRESSNRARGGPGRPLRAMSLPPDSLETPPGGWN